jgi:uncharacterized protein YggE
LKPFGLAPVFAVCQTVRMANSAESGKACMFHRLVLAAAVALATIPTSARAQAPQPEQVIEVTGSATVRTAPDLALLTYWLRGEGTTADQAAAALVATQKAVEGGLAGLLGTAAEITTGAVTLVETRDRSCDDGRGQPRLSQGACAPTGYMARLDSSVRTTNLDKAGTAVGLAGRLGARDARLTGHVLADPADAMKRATLAAIRDARARAEAAAAGAGVGLGPLLLLRDQTNAPDLVVTARRMDNAPAPPPPPPPPPIEISLKPKPIETRAQVVLRYAIKP